MYGYGRGVPQDFTVAAQWLEKSAEQGVAVAQLLLAESYAQGLGVPKNDEQAVKWYRKAAEQGDADAEYSLGDAYHGGVGVPQDYAAKPALGQPLYRLLTAETGLESIKKAY